MRRDILFLVRGLPEAFRTRDKHYFMAAVADTADAITRKLGKALPEMGLFLDQDPKAKLTFVGFRNDYSQENEAIGKAWENLEGILDGLSFVMEETLPAICPVIFIREEANENAKVIMHATFGWATIRNPPFDSADAAWEERRTKLFTRLLLFFDVVARHDSNFTNDLGYQIGYSAKMARCGMKARNFGVEFLCKFSAMEGLVCGSATKQKGELLKSRISALFLKSTRDVTNEIKMLWELRSEASHQAKAFYDPEIADSKAFHAEIVMLDFYLTGILVFALDNVDQTKSIDDLWSSKLLGYALPDYALMERPHAKVGLERLFAPTTLMLTSIGHSIDSNYIP